MLVGRPEVAHLPAPVALSRVVVSRLPPQILGSVRLNRVRRPRRRADFANALPVARHMLRPRAGAPEAVCSRALFGGFHRP